MANQVPTAYLAQGAHSAGVNPEENERHPSSTAEGLDLLQRVAFLAVENFEALEATGTTAEVVERLRLILNQMQRRIPALPPEPNSAQQQQGSAQ